MKAARESCKATSSSVEYKAEFIKHLSRSCCSPHTYIRSACNNTRQCPSGEDMIKISPPELLRRLLLDFNLLNSHVRVHGSCLLDCLCQSLVVIYRVTVRLDGNLLLHPCFNNSILFRLVLKCKEKNSILLDKKNDFVTKTQIN